MQSTKQIASEIIAREGGYENDPDDPGGATNFGVTIHTMRRLGMDLTQDGQIDEEDVRQLSRGQALEIFLTHYFKRPGLSGLPEPLQPSVFDMYVNSGANAVRILQNLVSEMGFEATPDGKIGPQTLRAVHKAFAAAPDHIVDAYGIARRNYYYSLADRRPASRKYARTRTGGKGGWIKRAEEFISAKFHLTEDAHSARVASWL